MTDTNRGSVLASQSGYWTGTNGAWVGDFDGVTYPVTRFGARGDSTLASGDDTGAVNDIVNLLATQGKAGRVLFHQPDIGKGYAITNLVVGKYTGTNYSFVQNITFEGEIDSYTGNSVNIFVPNGERAGFLLEHTRNIVFKNLKGHGMNTYLGELKAQPADFDTFWDLNNFVSTLNTVSVNRYAPHAFIVVDFASSTTPTQYPGLGQWYVGSGGGSAETRIENCAASDFYAGIVLNSATDRVQGEGVSIVNYRTDGCTYPLGVGQPQSRGCELKNSKFQSAYIGVTTSKFGQGIGVLPSIDVGHWEYLTYLFEADLSRGGGDINKLDCEVIGSIGQLGGGVQLYPLLWTGGHIGFQHQSLTKRVAESDGIFYSNVKFIGVRIYNSQYVYPFHFNVQDQCVDCRFLDLDNVNFWNDYSDSVQDFFSINSPAAFDAHRVFRYDNTFSGGREMISDTVRVAALANLNRRVLAPGQVIKVGSATYMNPDVLPLITINSSAGNITGGVGSFTTTTPERLRVGDAVLKSGGSLWPTNELLGLTLYGDVNMYMGRVAGIDYTNNIVYCDSIPFSLTTNADFQPDAIRPWPRYHSTTTGDTTSGSTNVDNVSTIANWKVGDRPKGTGIPTGVWVQGISGNTIQLSKAATASNVGIDIHDIELTGFGGLPNSIPVITTNTTTDLSAESVLTSGQISVTYGSGTATIGAITDTPRVAGIGIGVAADPANYSINVLKNGASAEVFALFSNATNSMNININSATWNIQHTLAGGLLNFPNFATVGFDGGIINATGIRSYAGLIADTTLKVGGGTEVVKIMSDDANLDFGSISANASADLTITVPGAGEGIGDVVDLGLPAAPAAGIIFNAFVSATNTVTVRAFNSTAAPVDPANALYRAKMTRF